MTPQIFFLPTGRLFLDIVFAGLPRWASPGEEIYAKDFIVCAGGSFNTTVACHNLGIQVGLCAHLGNDFSSKAIRQAIVDAGISIDYLIEHNTSMQAVTASFSRQEDRAFVSYIDPIPEFSASDLPEHGTPDIVFVPGFPEDPPALFDYLDSMKSKGSKIVCDSQHVEKTIEDPDIHGLIERFDIFMCNEKEAFALTRQDNPEEAAVKLLALCPEVAIKVGPKGALAATKDGIINQAATPITPADTTGAGDGFDAGYLYGDLHDFSIERKLKLGNVAGGYATACIGGSAYKLTTQKLLELESTYYD